MFYLITLTFHSLFLKIRRFSVNDNNIIITIKKLEKSVFEF